MFKITTNDNILGFYQVCIKKYLYLHYEERVSISSLLSEVFSNCPHLISFFYASIVTPHIMPWFPNSCLYLILKVLDIDLCSMECNFPRSRAWKVTFRAHERGK